MKSLSYAALCIVFFCISSFAQDKQPVRLADFQPFKYKYT